LSCSRFYNALFAINRECVNKKGSNRLSAEETKRQRVAGLQRLRAAGSKRLRAAGAKVLRVPGWQRLRLAIAKMPHN